ncbi:sugar phosphate isomerase/epimerase family protein [Jeotgalibacillus malaysiensis]|uniref:sugar phosphate isomerase/epimerase family protein n=1 Tax=Jeotgalibacillus malaysiensis TaxID=1508404 RepID=UPI00384F30B4
MKVGYMTNSFGLLIGSGAGVTSAKDIRYETICNDEDVIKTISSYGYSSIELFDGNLERFEKNREEFKGYLRKYEIDLLGVYVGANFIYEDSLEDELWRINLTAELAADFGAKHIVLGGGAVRAKGNTEQDYVLLGQGLDQAREIIEKHGLIASYHPHLGSMVETPEQIDKIFSLTSIPFCPDLAHLAAGGGNPLEIVKKYYERIHYIHLKDLKDSEFVPLGQGTLALDDIIQFLKSKDFNGEWLVEIDGFSGDPEEACKISYEFLEGKL